MSGDDKLPALNLREVTAYDKDGKVITPLSTRLSSEHSNGSVGHCDDGKIDDKFCHSDNAKDKDPWLVFGYRADAGISKIVVHNRIGCCTIRIVGATIRICSDSGKGKH